MHVGPPRAARAVEAPPEAYRFLTNERSPRVAGDPGDPGVAGDPGGPDGPGGPGGLTGDVLQGLARLGADAATVAGYVRGGGSLALSWAPVAGAQDSGVGVGAALARTGHGVPDFAADFVALQAAGAAITGAVPPSGANHRTYVLDGGTAVVYAAQLQRRDGSPPTFIAGASLHSADDATAAARQDTLQAITRYLLELTNSRAAALPQLPFHASRASTRESVRR